MKGVIIEKDLKHSLVHLWKYHSYMLH